MHADNMGLFATGSYIAEMERSINKDLSRLSLWLQANKLSINAVKSKFMIIASPYYMSKLAERHDIKKLGKSVEQVTSIDCLRMIVDQRLKSDKHVCLLCKH